MEAVDVEQTHWVEPVVATAHRPISATTRLRLAVLWSILH
jgi:hypothetical protein